LPSRPLRNKAVSTREQRGGEVGEAECGPR
jgi:hypothetical protein